MGRGNFCPNWFCQHPAKSVFVQWDFFHTQPGSKVMIFKLGIERALCFFERDVVKVQNHANSFQFLKNKTSTGSPAEIPVASGGIRINPSALARVKMKLLL